MDVHRPRPAAEVWRTEGYTTLVLERNGADEWRVTQDGIDVVGRGESAGEAAADYCLTVAEGTDD